MSRENNTTAQALINAGLELFGEYGPDGTSTRMLAQKAGVNISAIAYHFQSKDNLYKAVIEHITHYFYNATRKIRSDISQTIKHRKIPAHQAQELIKRLIIKLIDMMIENEEVRRFSRLMIREQINPSSAFQIIYDGYIKDFVLLLSTLVSYCKNIKASSDEAIMRSHSIIGQVITFVVTREALLRNLGATKLSKKQIAMISDILVSTVSLSLER